MPKSIGSKSAAHHKVINGKNLKYHFVQNPRFRIHFPKRIDLKFALLLPSHLVYSCSVQKALRHNKCRHVSENNGRCAGFALGSSLFYQSELQWYIFTLQSDLAFSRSSVLRDSFRGWRLVLIRSILELGREAGVSSLFLVPSISVYRSVPFFRFKENLKPPNSWVNIYDRTALDLNMQLVKVPNAINIQVMPRCRAYPISEFYKTNLSTFQL